MAEPLWQGGDSVEGWAYQVDPSPGKLRLDIIANKGRVLVSTKTRVLLGTAVEFIRKVQMGEAISRKAFTHVYCWRDGADIAKVSLKITNMKNKICHTFIYGK